MGWSVSSESMPVRICFGQFGHASGKRSAFSPKKTLAFLGAESGDPGQAIPRAGDVEGHGPGLGEHEEHKAAVELEPASRAAVRGRRRGSEHSFVHVLLLRTHKAICRLLW